MPAAAGDAGEGSKGHDYGEEDHKRDRPQDPADAEDPDRDREQDRVPEQEDHRRELLIAHLSPSLKTTPAKKASDHLRQLW
jgi:hypothetical protein